MVLDARRVVLILAVAGLLLSGAAAWVHYQLIVTPSYTTACDINATFSCTQVYLSPYGSIGGVPVALGGIFWAGLVWILAAGIEGRSAETRQVLGAYLFALGVIGLAVSAYFAYISFVVLGVKCIFCLGTYACVIGIAGAASRLPRVPLSALPGRLFADVATVVRTGTTTRSAGVLIAATLGLVVLFARLPEVTAAEALAAAAPVQSIAPSASAGGAVDQFVEYWNSLERVDVGVPADGARIVIVKFQDFMCPTCKITYEGYKPVLEKFAREMPGAIKYVEKDFPLESECNPNLNGSHVYSCEAAGAVRLAQKAGKGPEFEEWIWTNQASLTTLFIKDGLARIAGVIDFDRQYPALIPEIQRDALEGQALQVSGTPTFFIAGRAVRHFDAEQQRLRADILSAFYFERAIQLALQEAGGLNR
jgi:uncharacterized membrane protein/protein-disulfide isomerase